VKATAQELLFPAFNYFLDESDADIAILRCQDSSFVAAFSAGAATQECIVEAAKEDYRKRVDAHRVERGNAAKGPRSA
jgi:hypothetical protein